jgi:opacity protein-like surface antigen
MFRHFYSLPALIAAATLSAPAQAEDGQLYGAIFVGDRLGSDQTFSGANLAGAPRVIESPTKDGVIGGAVLGVIAKEGSWGRLRAEGEIAASKNSVKRLILNDVERELLEGRKSATTVMANLVYDTPKLLDRVRFSVGGGFGVAAIDYNIRYNVSAAGPAILIPTNVSGRLGIQAIGGVSVDLTPRFALTADVRYLHVDAHQVERFNQTAGTLDSTLRAKYDSTSVTTGVRYFF